VIVQCRQCGAKNRVEPEMSRSRQPVCGKCGFGLLVPDTDASKPLIVSDRSFTHDVVEAPAQLPVMVDCWAEWCGPCHMLAPVIDQLAAEANGRYRIAKLNTDENPATANSFQIRSIPTMLIFKNGQLVDRLVGVQPKQIIAARLALHFS
jgi:thioredoxin